MKRLFWSLMGMTVLSLLFAAIAVACAGEEVVKEVEVPVVVEKEVVKEVEVPGETVVVEKEVIKEVEVPGETVVVEKEVVREVEKPVVVEVEVEKELPSYQAAALERYGGKLRITSEGSLSQLDPFALKGYVDMQVAQHMWDGLFNVDLTVNTQPVLVESWSASADGMVYTIKLRSGLTFHDGSPITTDDAIPSILRWMDSRGAGGKTLKGFMAEDPLKKVDDLTFTLTLGETFGSTLECLGGSQADPPLIFPEEVARIDPTIDMASVDENYYNLGSGPYKLKEWKRGDRITIERYEGYKPRNEPNSWRAGRQNQYLDEITWIEVPSEETKIAGLKTGIYDVVEKAGLDFFGTLNDHPDIDVHMCKTGKSSININLHKAESIMTRDVKVRQALNANIDVDDFMGVLGPGELWWKCSALFGHCKGTPWKWETRVADPLYSQNDIDKAKSLLADSTYAGEPVHVMAPTDYATITPMGPILKDMMEEIGFNVEMPAINWANLLSRLGDTDWDLFTSYEGIPYPSPLFDGHLDLTYAWVHDWTDRTLPELKAKFLRETDPAKAMEIVEEINWYWYDQLPFFYLGYFTPLDGYRKTVHGMSEEEQPNVGLTYYANVWIEK